MGRAEEIEAAIDGLPPEEYQRVVQWFRVREQRRWDDQLDADSSARKLDFLLEEAKSESARVFFVTGPRKSEILRYSALPFGVQCSPSSPGRPKLSLNRRNRRVAAVAGSVT